MHMYICRIWYLILILTIDIKFPVAFAKPLHTLLFSKFTFTYSSDNIFSSFKLHFNMIDHLLIYLMLKTSVKISSGIQSGYSNHCQLSPYLQLLCHQYLKKNTIKILLKNKTVKHYRSCFIFIESSREVIYSVWQWHSLYIGEVPFLRICVCLKIIWNIKYELTHPIN